MSVEYGGRLTLGQILPLPAAAQADLVRSLNAEIGHVTAPVAGLGAITARPPPSLLQLRDSILQALDALTGLIADPLPDLSAVLPAISDLTAQLGSLNARLVPALALGNLFGAAGVHYYLFAGEVQTLGPELAALLSSGLPGAGPTANATGVVLLATDAGAVEAIKAVFRS
jgi:hypothetical protein